MGVVTGVQPDPDGEHIWIVERCGANQCAGSALNPIHNWIVRGARSSRLVQVFCCFHGFDMDADGNLWVTEGAPEGDARENPDRNSGWGIRSLS